MKLAGALLIALALSRCDGGAAKGTDLVGGPVPQDTAAQQTACEKGGGRWGRGGKAGFFVCYTDTRDSGRSCTKSTDCEGMCLARSRTCAPVKPLFGCNELLDEAGRVQSICID